MTEQTITTGTTATNASAAGNKEVYFGGSFDIAFVLGFASFLVLGRRSYLGFVFTNASAESELSGTLFLVYVLLSAVCVELLFLCRRRLIVHSRHKRVVLFACMLLSIVGALLVSLVGTGSPMRTVVSCVGVACFASGAMAMALGFYGMVIERRPHIRQLGILVASSYLVASLISLCSSLLSGLTSFVFTIVCPLATAAMWLACSADKQFTVAAKAEATAEEKTLGAMGLPASAIGEKRSFPFDVVFLACSFIICSVLLGCGFGTSLSGVVKPVYIGTHFVLLIVCGALICLFTLLKESKNVLTTLEITGVLIIIAAFFFLALANAEWIGHGADIVASSRLCFEMLLWLALFDVGAHRPKHAMEFFAALLGLRVVSDAITNLLAPNLAARLGEAFVVAVFKISLALFFLVALGFLVYKIAVLLKNSGEARQAAQEPQDRFSQVCHELADEYDLSPREHEIMMFIARGHSSRRIAEALCVSVSTVQTHSKNIYRKLGIHGKQDLIELTAGTLHEE